MSARKKVQLLTILKQHADSAGRVQVPLDRIRLELGSDRHDTIKDLFELKAVGKIDFALERGDRGSYPDRIQVLAARNGKPKRADRGVEILTWIRAHGGNEGGWVTVYPRPMAQGFGISYETLLTNMRRLHGKGVINIQYKGNGPKSGLEAVRVPAWSAAKPVAPEPAQATVPATPLLDAYRAARDFAAANPNNPFITFEPVAIAEEALAEIDRLRGAA